MDLHTLARRINRSLVPMYRSLYFPPAIVFLVIIAGVIFGWQNACSSLYQSISMAAETRANASSQALKAHFLAYEQILRGGAGLFEGSDQVDKAEWDSIIKSFSTGSNFNDMLSIGLIRVFAAADAEEVIRSAERQGIDTFTLTPAQPPTGIYAALMYATPLEPVSSVPYGFDVYSVPIRRATMFHARDSGNISMTPPVAHLLPFKGEGTSEFTLYAPFYDRSRPQRSPADRQTALRGYIYASFSPQEFFDSLLPQTQSTGILATARVGGKQAELYRSPSYDHINQPAADGTEVTKHLNLYGQTWQVHFVYDIRALVSKEQLSRPALVLFFGVVSAALMSSVVFLLLRGRAQDLSLQKEQAVELAKDELLSLASHQLRTPATGVKQYLGMVLQGFAGKVTPSQQQLLDKAYASNDRQLRIINEILHLAKIGSGRIVLAKQPTNLNELIADIVNEQRQDIDSARHEVTLKLPQRPIMVFADTHMLRMALENVLSNSIKYTPSGGKIGVRLRRQKYKAHITISDTGVGIKPEDMGEIFRQFSRLPNEMSQQVGGTGIGLYLAKHLIELHKGDISVKSEPGKGSDFTITLPLHGSASGSMRNLTVEAKS